MRDENCRIKKAENNKKRTCAEYDQSNLFMEFLMSFELFKLYSFSKNYNQIIKVQLFEYDK